jgi:carboxylesterase type B
LQQLHVEEDEAEQKRVMEYLALADWAARAAVQAVKSDPKAMDLRAPIEALAKTLQSQVLLIIGDVAEDKQYFAQLHLKLDERFSNRLGLQLPKPH